MRGNSNPFKGYRMIYAKIAGVKKGSTSVYFALEEKKSDGAYGPLAEEPETNQLGGYLVDIKADSYEYEGDIVKTVVMYIADPDDGEVYKIECGWNKVSRSIVNALLGAGDSIKDKKIVIRLYNLKEGDYKGSPRAWVGVFDGGSEPVRLDWKYSPDEVEAKIDKLETKDSKGNVKKTEVDFSRLDEWLSEQLSEVVKTPIKQSSVVQNAQTFEAKDPEPESQDDGDPMSKIDAASDEKKPEKIKETVDDDGEVDDLPF